MATSQFLSCALDVESQEVVPIQAGASSGRVEVEAGMRLVPCPSSIRNGSVSLLDGDELITFHIRELLHDAAWPVNY